MYRGIEVELDVTDTGIVPQRGVFVPPSEGIPQDTRLKKVLALIEDPSATDVGGIQKLIAAEIADTLSDVSSVYNSRSVSEKIKGLQALSKTVMDADSLSKRDFLNFDGPKFQFVLTELVGVFKQSLADGGLPADTVNHILRTFSLLLKSREEDIRKATERVDSSSCLTPLNHLEGNRP